MRKLTKFLATGIFVLGCSLSISTFASASTADIAINDTNFPDSNFKAYVYQNFDQDKNNTLSATEISSATDIDVSAKNIQLLTGLEYFTSLKELDCSNNNLSSISLAKNTALEKFDCANNNLIELSFTTNPKLNKVIAYGNKLSSIDVSKNTNLQSLYCSDNLLSQLSVVKNTKLDTLVCANNQLNNLDLSNNTLLSNLTCYSNQITSMDLSKNKQLTYLLCYDNKLTSMNLSQNTSLNHIDCSSNSLSTLDVSANTKLEILDCGENLLTSLNLTTLTGLRNFSCENNRLQLLDLSSQTALYRLDASDNNLAYLDLSNCTDLSAVDVSNNSHSCYVDSNGVVDTSKIAGFSLSNVTNITNATNAANELKLSDITKLDKQVITYNYNMGNSLSDQFSINTVTSSAIQLPADHVDLYLSSNKATYLINPINVSGSVITWISSDTDIATVSPEGLVTANECGTVTITGTTESGSVSCQFTIYKETYNLTVSNIVPQPYNGKAVTPVPEVTNNGYTLYYNKDFTVTYENNNTIGEASAIIKGIGIYKFETVVHFTIYYNIGDVSIAAIPDQVYTGSEIKPTLVLKNGTTTLVENNDYTIAYSNNINLGTATITIIGKGYYHGSRTLTFNIIIPSVTGLAQSGDYTNQITLTWNKTENVSGYRLYRYNDSTKKYESIAFFATNTTTNYTDKSLKAGISYHYRIKAYKVINGANKYSAYSTTFITATKTSKNVLKVKAGKKKATITWTKASNASGYKLYMATSKYGKYTKLKTITGNSTFKYTKKSLKKGKYYYFKIRSYKKASNIKHYSSYSAIKACKVK